MCSMWHGNKTDTNLSSIEAANGLHKSRWISSGLPAADEKIHVPPVLLLFIESWSITETRLHKKTLSRGFKKTYEKASKTNTVK